MAAGVIKSFRINSKSFYFPNGVASINRTMSIYRTIEDSYRNRTPAYDDKDKPEYDKSKPSWDSLNIREQYTKNRYKSRIMIMRPDYTFVDGRPTPLGGRMRYRLERQMEFAEKIVQYTKEMDFAVERHAAMQKAAEDERTNRIESKLKPKGQALLNEMKSADSKRNRSVNVELKTKVKKAKESEDVKTKT